MVDSVCEQSRYFDSAVHASISFDTKHNYLLLSDVHLGSDIVPHSRPWATTSWLREEPEVDSQLIGLLEHYRNDCDQDRPWRLVIAGDFLDLVGVSITAHAPELRTRPTREEEMHGLGSAADHVVHKVRAIAHRHVRVFRALMAFLADGHSLVLVRGNHDVELHWRAAQRAFIDAVVEHADEAKREQLAARIAICPWFFAVDGLLYVEHGHEFDGMCSYGDPLSPTCRRDPKRIRCTPFSVLLRHVARPSRGLSTTAYGYAGMGAYGRLVFKLGLRSSARIALRFARASSRLLRECLSHDDRKTHRQVLKMDAAHRRFVARNGVSAERVTALMALYVKPAARSLDFVVRSLYLDRLACLVLAIGFTATAACTAHSQTWLVGVTSVLLSALLASYACIGRGSNASPAERMKQGAERIAGLFRARWVVMGHTHEPCLEPLEGRASYVNLGSWGEDELPDEKTHAAASPCTFLVLRYERSDYTARLLRWDVRRGPQPFVVPSRGVPSFSPAPIGSIRTT